MRWALFWPTPGSTRKASISSRIRGLNAMSERHLEAGRHLQAGSHAGHAVLAVFLNLAHGIVDCSSDQVFQNLLVFFQQAVVNTYTAHIVTARHHYTDHTGTGFTGHFRIGQLFLHFLHFFLHHLGLLHQASHTAFHREFPLVYGYLSRLNGIMWPDTVRQNLCTELSEQRLDGRVLLNRQHCIGLLPGTPASQRQRRCLCLGCALFDLQMHFTSQHLIDAFIDALLLGSVEQRTVCRVQMQLPGVTLFGNQCSVAHDGACYSGQAHLLTKLNPACCQTGCGRNIRSKIGIPFFTVLLQLKQLLRCRVPAGIGRQVILQCRKLLVLVLLVRITLHISSLSRTGRPDHISNGCSRLCSQPVSHASCSRLYNCTASQCLAGGLPSFLRCNNRLFISCCPPGRPSLPRRKRLVPLCGWLYRVRPSRLWFCRCFCPCLYTGACSCLFFRKRLRRCLFCCFFRFYRCFRCFFWCLIWRRFPGSQLLIRLSRSWSSLPQLLSLYISGGTDSGSAADC